MPYKAERIPIAGSEHDRRIRMNNVARLLAKKLYRQGLSIRGIARYFKVDKRLIGFILFPERQKRNLELRKQRGGWIQYYSKEKHRESMKSHRRYKNELLKKGKIK